MTESQEIKKVLLSSFQTALSGYTVRYPNSNFTTPNGSPWCSFSVLNAGTFMQTLNDTDRVNGIVQIDCYMPKLKGDNYAYEVCDALKANLNNNGIPLPNSFGTSKVQILTVGQPRNSQDPNWHRMIIDVNFYAFVGR